MQKPTKPIAFYNFPFSGHAHRVKCLLNMLELPYEPIMVDLAAGEQKSPAYLAINPFGLVPSINDDGVVIWDSNAILLYLALKYDDGRFLPKDAIGAAQVQAWLGVAAGPLANGPATARRLHLFKQPGDSQQAQKNSEKLFQIMNAHLLGRQFFVAERLTLADLALYFYTAHAPEGGVSLEPYSHLRAWIARVESAPRFTP